VVIIFPLVTKGTDDDVAVVNYFQGARSGQVFVVRQGCDQGAL
jgi:hypothetical protein